MIRFKNPLLSKTWPLTPGHLHTEPRLSKVFTTNFPYFVLSGLAKCEENTKNLSPGMNDLSFMGEY